MSKIHKVYKDVKDKLEINDVIGAMDGGTIEYTDENFNYIQYAYLEKSQEIFSIMISINEKDGNE